MGARASEPGSAILQVEAVDLPDLPTGPTWCVGKVYPVPGGADTYTGCVVDGWFVAPATATVEVAVDGRRYQPQVYRRAILDEFVHAGTGNRLEAFRIRAEPRGERAVRLDLVIDGTVVDDLAYHYPAGDQVGPVPVGELRTRVHGDDTLSAFLVEGHTAYRVLRDLLAELAPERDGPIRLLDWGVGCARVARYFVADEGFELSGIDIDADNVAWCRNRLDGRFEVVDPHPPTGFEHGLFDAIIGVSVMTHLDSRVQREWLAHLSELLTPGGVALLTTHGWTTARRGGIPRSMLATLRHVGFLDAGENPNIPESVVESGYYRNVYNTPEWVRAHWTGPLVVEEVIPGRIGMHQDVVVLRKPG